MEISSIQNYYMAQTAVNTPNTSTVAKAAEESGAQAAETRGTDTIDISSEASFKSDLGKYAKVYSAKNSEGVTSERISQLKQQYQGDACPISGSNIASKIIAGILGPDANN